MAQHQLKHKLIAINGEIGSGKDTITAMIQDHELTKDLNFRNVKFATKLKQICGLLVGVDPIMFEDQDFKMKKLPPIWGFYKLHVETIIMEPVKLRYINSNVQKSVSKTITYERMPDGRAIRTPDDVAEMKEHLLKKYPAAIQITAVENTYTYRQMLQYIGTELLRNQFHPDVHVMTTFADYNAVATTWDDEGNTTVSEYPNWVISDLRFKNEASHVRSRGGFLIRVERYNLDDLVTTKEDHSRVFKVLYYDTTGVLASPVDGGAECFIDYNKVRKHKPDAHESEKELDDYPFDLVIYNCDTMEYLEKAVDLFVRKQLYEETSKPIRRSRKALAV